MIVDFVLDVLFAVPNWILGLLPEGVDGNPLVGHGIGTWQWDLGYWFGLANYFLPISELLVYVPWAVGMFLLVQGIRWVLRLIPGMG